MGVAFYITTKRIFICNQKMYCSYNKIYQTKKPFDIIDITDDIQQFITDYKCKD